MKRRRLSRVQLEAISLLSSGIKVTDVAKKLGISVSTVYKWRRDKFFLGFLNAEIRALQGAEDTAIIDIGIERGIGIARDVWEDVYKKLNDSDITTSVITAQHILQFKAYCENANWRIVSKQFGVNEELPRADEIF